MKRSTPVEALASRATDCPDTLAFEIEGETSTYRQLHDDVVWLARRLAGVGVARTSRCAIMLPTSLDFVRTVFAAQMLGAIPVAIDPGFSDAAQDLRLGLVGPSVVLTTDEHAARLRRRGAATDSPTILTASTLRSLVPASGAVAMVPSPEDIAYLQFTSGTSGDPRACAVSYRALMAALGAMAERYRLTPDDVLANWLPLHYSSGLVRHVFGTIVQGCPSHLIRPSAMGLARWLRLISDTRATITTSPDFAYRLAARMVAPSRVDLRSLRIAINGGEAVRASTIADFEGRFGLSRIVQPAYGITEGTLVISSSGPGDERHIDATGNVSCGCALNGVEIRVVDGTGAECERGVEGEIQFRGDVLFSGYFGDEIGTRQVVRDGWCQPGDLGVVDRAGHVYVRSRVRALIKRGGAGISPREIEEPVERLDGVERAAAVGINRAAGSTEEIVIVVEILETQQAEAAHIACDVQRVAAEAVGLMPASVLVVRRSAIPCTASGKVRHAELRALISEADFLDSAYFSG